MQPTKKGAHGAGYRASTGRCVLRNGNAGAGGCLALWLTGPKPGSGAGCSRSVVAGCRECNQGATDEKGCPRRGLPRKHWSLRLAQRQRGCWRCLALWLTGPKPGSGAGCSRSVVAGCRECNQGATDEKGCPRRGLPRKHWSLRLAQRQRGDAASDSCNFYGAQRRCVRYVCIAVLALVMALAGCESARLPVEAGIGPNPKLLPPNPSLIPTVDVAPAKGWPAGTKPSPSEALQVNAFATDLVIRAGLCPAERRCSRRRDERSTAPGGRQGDQGLLHEACS